MKKLSRSLSMFLVLMIFLGLTAGSVCALEAEDGKLVFQVTDIEEVDDTKVITIEYINSTGYSICLGWVSSCDIRVTTDQGTFSHTIFGSEKLTSTEGILIYEVKDCPGEVEMILITDVRTLNDRGLPEKQLKNLQIYKAEDPDAQFSHSFLSGVPGSSASLDVVLGEASGSMIGPSGIILIFISALAVFAVVLVMVLRKFKKSIPQQPAPAPQPVYSPLNSEAGTAGSAGAAGSSAPSDPNSPQ